jgi:hypothetical protein
MSTHIVDRIEAVRFPKEATGYYEDVYLVLELGGDNNVRDSRNRRARSWGATCIGSEWEVIGKCCRFAAGCSGGMTKLRGRKTTPESYIRAYRKALANAADGLTGAAERHLHVTGRIRFDRSDKNAAHLLREAELAGKIARDETRYGETRAVIHFDLANPADLALWYTCQHGNGWNNAEVGGPGEI